MNAVITADIVNSTLMGKLPFNDLLNHLQQLFGKNNIEIYRGDSFQAYVKNAEDALLNCVKSRVLAIQHTSNHRIDIRMSISIGILNDTKARMGSNMAELLVNSGRHFDRLQTSSRKLYITSIEQEKNFTYDIIAEYLDSILERITAKQADVLYPILSGKTQVETARLLNKTTATISQHVKTARYDEIENILNKFKILTNQLQNGK
jgi:hypothetical protein